MAKLTKAQRRQIESALASMEAGLKFIESDSVTICKSRDINAAVPQGPMDYRAATPHRTQDYVGRDDSTWSINFVKELSPIDKGVGSNLVQLYTAAHILRGILES